MNVRPAPERTKPVNLPHAMVQNLSSGRIRALALPLGQYEHMKRGDLLWVREGVTVADRQRRKDELVLSYAGDARRYHIAWPALLAKPGAGYRPADAMPVQTSRFTLVVDQVERLRLANVTEDDAVAAGAQPDGDGYSALGYPFMKPCTSAVDALAFLYGQLHPGGGRNPEVVLIRFHAVAKNIARYAVDRGRF